MVSMAVSKDPTELEIEDTRKDSGCWPAHSATLLHDSWHGCQCAAHVHALSRGGHESLASGTLHLGHNAPGMDTPIGVQPMQLGLSRRCAGRTG